MTHFRGIHIVMIQRGCRFPARICFNLPVDVVIDLRFPLFNSLELALGSQEEKAHLEFRTTLPPPALRFTANLRTASRAPR